MIDAALAHAARVAAPLIDPAPLHAAATALATPWTWVSVGRAGVGKTTALERVAPLPIPAPTGLGGVWRELGDGVPLRRRRRDGDRPVSAAAHRQTQGQSRVDAADVRQDDARAARADGDGR